MLHIHTFKTTIIVINFINVISKVHSKTNKFMYGMTLDKYLQLEIRHTLYMLFLLKQSIDKVCHSPS